MNQFTFIGRLTKDVELKTGSSGKSYADVTIAINRPGAGEEADFPRVRVFDKAAENLAKYSGKGLLVAVEGRVETGTFQKDGQTVYTTRLIANRVEFLQFKETTGAEY